VLVVVVLGAVERKVASTMYQLVAAPRVRLPCCGPAALDRMSSRSEASLPLCTSRRYGTLGLLPGVAQPGLPPVRTAATTSAPARTGSVRVRVCDVERKAGEAATPWTNSGDTAGVVTVRGADGAE